MDSGFLGMVILFFTNDLNQNQSPQFLLCLHICVFAHLSPQIWACSIKDNHKRNRRQGLYTQALGRNCKSLLGEVEWCEVLRISKNRWQAQVTVLWQGQKVLLAEVVPEQTYKD